MSGFEVPNLAYLRNIPVIGSRLYEAFHGAQKAINTMAVQANLNPTGKIDPPPAIQSVNAIGKNGVLHVSIEHTAADVSRGITYYVEHADNPSFTNPQIVNVGDSRSYSEFVGAQSRYVRAYASYPGSPAGAAVYHGGAASPQSVDAGGSVGPSAFLPSQGSGTGAPGQGGVGPGPIQVRTDSSGFDWRLQRPISTGGFGPGSSPGDQNGIGSDSGSGSGGGGGGIVSQPIIVDTHANRLASYPSVRYPVNTEFYESDRTCWYWVQNASGTVTVTTGTTVTWNSGNHFINTGTGFNAAQWPAGTRIVINGITCHVATVSSPTSLTLQAATTNAGPVSYSVASGRWVYEAGEYRDVYGNLPTDLGENDYVSATNIGFQFFDTTHWRLFQWAATGGGPAASSPGWKRGVGEVPTGQISILPFGGGQMATGWSLCNGTTGVSVTEDDASTTARDMPNLAGGAYPKGGTTGTYGPTGATPNAATVPAIGGHTDNAATGISVSGAGAATASTGTALAGATQSVLTALTSGGGGGGAVTDPTHNHLLTPANAPITLPGDPVANVVVPFYMKR